MNNWRNSSKLYLGNEAQALNQNTHMPWALPNLRQEQYDYDPDMAIKWQQAQEAYRQQMDEEAERLEALKEE